MNRSQLRQRVKELMAMGITDPTTDSGRPSNAQINQAITEARNMIYMKLQSELPRRFGQTTTLEYGSNVESMILPLAARGMPVFAVEYGATGETSRSTLDQATIEEFRNMSEYGDPMCYAVVKDVIYLRPRPQSSLTLTIYHTPVVVDMTDIDSPEELATPFHHLIAYGAAIRIKRGYGDPTDDMVNQFEEDFRTLVAHYETQQKDHHIQEVQQAEFYYGY
jgi:hypothetical protein